MSLSRILVVGLFVLSATVVHGQELSIKIESYVDHVCERIGFRGAILVAKDGQVLFSEGRGTIAQDSDIPIDHQSLFEIASCTKPLTALAVMKLAEEGKLDLDDSIAKHLEGVPENCHAISVRHLLNHTSGIPGSNVAGHPSDFRIALRKFLNGGPRREPGTRYEYWNQGYAILSEVITQASGKPYTEYLRSSIFEPASMKASCFTGDTCPDGMKDVIGTAQGRAPRSALEHPYGSYGYQYRGMGGVVTNLRDVYRLDRALAERKLLSESSLNEMIAVKPGKTGLGWNITLAPDGSNCHGHNGSVRGFLASITRYPSIDGCIVIFECDQNSTSFTALQAGLAQLLFGKSPSSVPSMISAADQRPILGEYVDQRRRVLSIKADARSSENKKSFPTLKIDWGGPSTFGMLAKDENEQFALYLASRSGLKKDCVIDFRPADSTAQTATLRLSNGRTLEFRRVEQ